MILKNGKVFENGRFAEKDIYIDKNKICDCSDGEVIDCSGLYVMPGFVDIHTHGCMGYDFSSSTAEEMHKMQEYYLGNGITSILATTVAMSNDDIVKAVGTVNDAMKEKCKGAEICGINLEGPYLSPEKCGAHDISLLKAPDIDFVKSLGSSVKIVDLAPEYNTSMDFIDNFGGKVSIAHTACDYDTAVEAVKRGADHITHIFNAMNGLHHRKPGVVGAFFDCDAVAEMICDTIHVALTVLRMMFSLKPEKIAVISDSMAATGLSDGVYNLGKLTVYVKDSVATLEDGTLAGSTMNIHRMGQKLLESGISLEKVVRSLTEIPADSVGIGDSKGKIEIGRQADVIVTDEKLNIKHIIFNGEII